MLNISLVKTEQKALGLSGLCDNITLWLNIVFYYEN